LIEKKTIRNQIEAISKEKQNLTNSCTKLRYDSKIIESSKKIWQTFKRKNTRLIRKSFFFSKILHRTTVYSYFSRYH
ncbi:predicted protein, partial [Arabidopsis lyrata subsp. lyrata]